MLAMKSATESYAEEWGSIFSFFVGVSHKDTISFRERHALEFPLKKTHKAGKANFLCAVFVYIEPTKDTTQLQ